MVAHYPEFKFHYSGRLLMKPSNEANHVEQVVAAKKAAGKSGIPTRIEVDK